jgi:hypothetical protein
MLMMLKSMEKMLQVVRCNNLEKVLLASHQLSGLTTDSWDAYVEAHKEPRASTGLSLELLSMLTMFPKV